jgi:hypothetical protein
METRKKSATSFNVPIGAMSVMMIIGSVFRL